MKTFKKIIAFTLAMAMVAAVSVGATVAYLQDTDSDVNVMTLGNVYIEQIEQERDENGNLVDFTQAKPAYPAVYEGSSIPWASEDKWIVPGNEAWKVVEDNANVIDKFVTVKNTGKSDAYVRTIIAFEVGKDSVNDAYMHFVCNSNDAVSFEWLNIDCVEIDGAYYALGVFTYTEALAPGATTIPSVKQVYLDKTATNEVCEAYGETFEILVFSQAVQTAGFADAQTALDTAFGEITATTHPWAKDFTMVNTAEELTEAIANGGTVTLTADVKLDDAPLTITKDTVLDLNGFELTGKSTSSTTSNLIKVNAGAELTIEDGVVSFYATTPDTEWGGEGQPAFPGYANNTISNSGKLTVKNATIENLTAKGGASYAIDCYPGADLYIEEGSVINGYDKIAIRMFANSKTLPTNVTINGGEVRGYRSVWIQLPSSDATVTPSVNLTVNGGELISTDPEYTQVIYSYSYGNSFNNTVIELNGGTYYGDVALTGGTKNGKETITIDKNNCTFYGAVYSYADADDEYIVGYDADKVYEAVASKEDVQEALSAAATAGATDVVVDANGTSLNLNYGLSKTTVPEGTTATIKNAVVEGKSYGNAVDGTVVFENCTFTNTGAYSIHFDAGSGHVVFKNCVLEGWCSFGSAIKSVTMEGCTIAGNGKYAMIRFYQDTTMTNCTIDCSNAPSDDSWVDGISAVEGATVTLTNCNIINAEWEVANGGKIVVNGITVAE